MIRLLPCLALLLAACQTSTPEAVSSCAPTAERLQATALGTPATEIEATAPEGRRVIGPDTVVTMDFVPERLNLETDAEGDLIRAYCG